MIYKSDFIEEQQYLNYILDILNENVSLLEIKTHEAFVKVKELYEQYTPDTPQFYMDIPVAEQFLDTSKKDLADSKKVMNSPYFGKTIFLYTGEENDTILYFGKKGIPDLKSKDNKMLIIDWRAPVADVYYNSKLGITTYTAPKGEIEIDLKLKTTIKIKDKQLINLYDAEVVTDDELLSDYLSQNKDVVLNDIIATIQEDQNKIIRKVLSKNLIVQGVAGSGKTTVALHRIAYLLYNYRDILTFENIYLIAANKLFLNYITSMLPDLDVPVIKQKMMTELLIDAIKVYEPKFKCETVLPPTKSEVYDNNNYLLKFESCISSIVDTVFEDNTISFFDFEILTLEETNKVISKKGVSIFEKAKELDILISQNVRHHKDKIIMFICANKKNKEVIKVVTQLFNITPDKMFEHHLNDKYPTFANKFKNHFRKKVKKISPHRLFSEFSGFNSTNYNINDLACYLNFLIEIFGSTDNDNIKHIVIDEAQDFGIVIYHTLKALFKKATFTVVGDIMQNIRVDGLKSWNLLKTNILGENTEYVELLKSYRNTIEISEFTQKVIKQLTGKTIAVEPIIRHGDEVVIHKYTNENDKIEKLNEILSLFETKKFNINAIICKNDDSALKLYNAVKDIADVNILDINDQSLGFGDYIVSLSNAKGLEFDSVIVWDFDNYNSMESNFLYVALTRALHRLEVFSNRLKFGVEI